MRSSVTSILDLLTALLPAGDRRVRLRLVAPPYLDDRGGLVAPLRAELYTSDGTLQDVHEASWIVASGVHMQRPERVAAYLEAWVDALPGIAARLDDSAMLDELDGSNPGQVLRVSLDDESSEHLAGTLEELFGDLNALLHNDLLVYSEEQRCLLVRPPV